MQKLKNWVQSGKRWTIVSTQIFAQNTQNFSLKYMNSLRIWKNLDLEIEEDNRKEKGKKKVADVC